MRRNGRNIARVDPVTENPRPVDGLDWHRRLVERLSAITAEWDAFATNGGRLPHIEDVLGEHQGNTGPWRVGLLVANGTSTRLARRDFTETLDAVRAIPGLRAALWSQLDAGTELTEHEGPNAGVLRYHLGIDCPEGSALRVDDREVPYLDGEGILFDDTAPHAAWNHAGVPRITLFCEVDRPLPAIAGIRNRCTQFVLGLDPRRRGFLPLADAWDEALNPGRRAPSAHRTVG